MIEAGSWSILGVAAGTAIWEFKDLGAGYRDGLWQRTLTRNVGGGKP